MNQRCDNCGNIAVSLAFPNGKWGGAVCEGCEHEQEVNQVSRPDFSALYSKMFHSGLATKSVYFGAFMSQRLLPQRAESRQFSYTDEDGQAHTTCRIDWNYIFGYDGPRGQ